MIARRKLAASEPEWSCKFLSGDLYDIIYVISLGQEWFGNFRMSIPQDRGLWLIRNTSLFLAKCPHGG